MEDRTQCLGETLDGRRCTRLVEGDYCHDHHPAEADELSDRERRFVLEYCVHGNASRAAREAGYPEANANRRGYELRWKPAIDRAIEEHLDRVAMTRSEATQRLAMIARGSPAPFLVHENGRTRVDLTTEEAQDAAYLLRKVTVDADGLAQFELHDAKDALVQLLKMHGAYADDHTHTVEHTASAAEIASLLGVTLDDDDD